MKGKMKEKAGRTVIGERRLSCITNLKIVLVFDREAGGRERKKKERNKVKHEHVRTDAPTRSVPASVFFFLESNFIYRT
jgi:hypothetical protein